MFGFQGGERPDEVARKVGYRQEAQLQWGFLTHLDLSTIKSEAQLSKIVRERSGISEEQATKDVHAWAAGKTF